jgi:hypothetical protein
MPRKSRLYYGQGTLVRAARLLAGFPSARSAANAFGWSEGLLRNHETGARRISADDERKYATAFGVGHDLHPVLEQLRQKFGPTFDPERAIAVLEQEAAGKPGRQTRISAAARLRFARLISGFSTASQACAHFGWGRRTYSSHELGANSYNAAQAEVYAFAFGTVAEWLRFGTGPTGWPEPVDDWVQRHSKEIVGVRGIPHELAAHVPIPRPRSVDVPSVPAKRGRPSSGVARIDFPVFDSPDMLLAPQRNPDRGFIWSIPRAHIDRIWGLAPGARLAGLSTNDGFLVFDTNDTSGDGESVFLNRDGEISVAYEAPGDSRCLGRLKASVKLRPS